MQLMTFNSLLMFDIVFMFFLFLVGVTCLVYYLPTGRPHRPFVQTAESLLEAEKCRYRHRHLHFLSQKNGHADRILTDEASSEYEEDEEDVNDDESDEFEEIPKTQSKKHHQQLKQEQHNCHIHNQNDKPCLDTKEINFIERNEIELVKLRNKGYYPLPRHQQKQKQKQHQRLSQGKENNNLHKSNKILYHCCPPCNLSDCENFYISYEDSSSNDMNNSCNSSSSNSNNYKGNNNDIYTSSMVTTYKDTDIVNTSIDDTISSSRLMYLNEIIPLERNDNSHGDSRECNISRNNGSSGLFGIDKIHKNRKSNYIDCKKNSPLLKLKSRAIINKKQTAAAIAKALIEVESTNKIQPILSLPSSILSTIDEKTNVPDDDDDDDDDDDVDDASDDDIDNNINDDEYEEYIDEDDDCCSTTSVDIVLAEGIDEDSSNVIIYDNKRKCQHINCRNKYINSNITTGARIAFNNNNHNNKNRSNSYNNNKNESSQPTSLNINAAAIAAAATLREHFYIIKETEKIKEGTTSFCNNCNLANYSSTSLTSSSCTNSLSTSSTSSPPLSSAHQVLQSCNNIPCPLLSSSSIRCTSSFNTSPLLNISTPLKSSSFISSPPDSPLLSSQLPYISSPSSGLRFSSSSSSNIQALAHQPYCCHVKAKSNDLKDCVGPIVDV